MTNTDQQTTSTSSTSSEEDSEDQTMHDKDSNGNGGGTEAEKDTAPQTDKEASTQFLGMYASLSSKQKNAALKRINNQ